MIEIFKCTPEDIDGIIAFIDAYKDQELFFYSKATIRRMVLGDNEGRKPYAITLAKDAGKIIGIAIVSSKSKTLSLLFVSPEYRRRRIGRDLYFKAAPKQILIKKSAIGYFARLESAPSGAVGARGSSSEPPAGSVRKTAGSERGKQPCRTTQEKPPAAGPDTNRSE